MLVGQQFRCGLYLAAWNAHALQKIRRLLNVIKRGQPFLQNHNHFGEIVDPSGSCIKIRMARQLRLSNSGAERSPHFIAGRGDNDTLSPAAIKDAVGAERGLVIANTGDIFPCGRRYLDG